MMDPSQDQYQQEEMLQPGQYTQEELEVSSTLIPSITPLYLV